MKPKKNKTQKPAVLGFLRTQNFTNPDKYGPKQLINIKMQ